MKPKRGCRIELPHRFHYIPSGALGRVWNIRLFNNKRLENPSHPQLTAQREPDGYILLINIKNTSACNDFAIIDTRKHSEPVGFALS